MRVVIIGAGLSGLTLAQKLSRSKVAVTVFERDAGPKSRGQGYRLTIDDVGSDALNACVPIANYEFIRSTAGAAGKSGAFIFLDENARELHRFVFETAQAERHGRITGQVDRQTLREALISGIEATIRWGMHFSHFESSPTGVRVHFGDGSSTVADLLVGADGSNSFVRKQLLSNAAPADTGRRAIFGRTPLADQRLPIVDGLLSDGGVMCLGPKGRVFFCTAMRYREQPSLAARRFGIHLDQEKREDYVMWAVVVPRTAIDIGEEYPSSTTLHDIALRESTPFAEQFRTLIQRADRDEAILVPLRTLLPKAWAPQRVTLVGDAIHVMPPFGAHGANTALKDAQILSRHILQDSGRADGLVARVGAYEAEMRAYSRNAVREASRMMTMTTADFPFKKAIFQVTLKVASAFSRKR
jgi:2-polyprenyl-6-methoxyphenol hydroxylase-like FAD-dependent oxidoreductase